MDEYSKMFIEKRLWDGIYSLPEGTKITVSICVDNRVNHYPDVLKFVDKCENILINDIIYKRVELEIAPNKDILDKIIIDNVNSEKQMFDAFHKDTHTL